MLKESKEIRVITILAIVTVLFVSFISMMSLYYINRLHSITQNIYNHPLKVSNAALEVQNGILKIHRDMKEILTSTSKKELQKLIKQVDLEEKRLSKNLLIIKNNILGKEGLELWRRTNKLFQSSYAIRADIIRLILEGKRSQAMKITKDEGKAHLKHLQQESIKLEDYAKEKADYFKVQANMTFEKFKTTEIILFCITMLLFILFTLYVRYKIKGYIQSIIEQEHFLQEAQRISSLGSWKLDLTTDTLTWSDEVYAIFEVDKEKYQPTQAAFIELIHPQDRDKVKEAYQHSIQTRKPYEILHRVILHNGKTKYLKERAETTFTKEGKPLRSIGAVQDITKEYLANQEISRVLSAFERSNISVVITDLDGNIEYVNPSWCKLTGYSKEELIGQNPRIVKSGYISDETYKKMWHELTHGRVWNSELKNRAKDGSEFWEDSTIMPSFDSEGNIDGYISFKLEISDKIHLRQELKEQEEIMILQSRHAAMGEMISMIAHQWRQPISVIAMDANNILVDIELDSIDPDSLQADLEDIISQTKYLSKTIDDFRNFFKPSRQKDKILVSEVFEEAYSVISKSLEHNNIEVEKRFQTDTEVSIYSRELLQVFINILKNAKEALVEKREDNRKITITIQEENNEIFIDICDNAKGIDAAYIDQIFDPYFTTKDEINGTGLGLYMSKTIIEKHFNGTIIARNEQEGACFEIQFPITKEEDETV